MEYKKSLLWISILSALIFFSIVGSSSAIGIAPSRTTLAFTPGLSGTFEYTIVNHEARDMSLDIYTRGELAEYVTLSKTYITVQRGTTAAFTADLTLPSGLTLEPGIHDTRIGIVQSVPTSGGGGATVVARTGVESQLWVQVPYPGKYLSVQLTAPDVEVNRQIDFAVKAQNFGSEDVYASGTVKVYDSSDNHITTASIGGLEIKPSITQTLHARLDNGLSEAGNYFAIATVDYDGESRESNDTFRVGTKEIEILNISGGEAIPQGTVAPLDVMAKSRWNSRIENVYAIITITDVNGAAVDELQTPSINFRPWEPNTLSTYWDTSNTPTADYTGTVTLYYEEKTSTAQATFHVVSGFEVGGTVVYVIILVLIVIIALFIFMQRRKKRKAEVRQ